MPGCASAAITVSIPVTVTVLDTNGVPQNALPVYAVDNATYTGYNKTTNASGQATLTLPIGSYRFRADKNGAQFWSGSSNHCTLPGCTSTTITIPVTSGYLGGVKVLAALPLSEANRSSTPRVGLQQSGTLTTTVIRCTYDLNPAQGARHLRRCRQPCNPCIQRASAGQRTRPLSPCQRERAALHLGCQPHSAALRGLRDNLLSDGNVVYAYPANSARDLRRSSQSADQRCRRDDDNPICLQWRSHSASLRGLRGARLQQIVNNLPTTYTLDLAAPLVQALSQQDTNGETTYLYGVTRVGEQQLGGWAYHLSDARPCPTLHRSVGGPLGVGSVRQLADVDGQVTLARGYTPYGEALWAQGAGQSAYGFTGEPLDVSTGLVFLRARYMNPTLGIFLSRDQWGGNVMRPGSMNGWAYTEGNPIMHIDPSGYQSCDPFDFKCLEEQTIVEKMAACYAAKNYSCLWDQYWWLATFGNLSGYTHAAAHMFNFLYKGGDKRYYESETDWVRDTSFVKSNLLEMKLEALSAIRDNAMHGNMADQVMVKRIIQLSESDIRTYRDLYYAMNGFTLMTFAQYRVRDCNAVRTAFINVFTDKYDWHKGLQTGGAETGIGAIKDEWTDALANAGMAQVFNIYGVWHELPMTYLFSSSWLVPNTEPQLIMVLPF